MDMGKEFIDKIESLADAARTVMVGDETYSAKQLVPVMYEPEASTLKVNTLSALCAFYNAGMADEPQEELFVNIVSPTEVVLFGGLRGRARRRSAFVVAETSIHEFSFGQFMPQEQFAISFRSLVSPKKGDDSDYVLSYIGRLRGGTTVEVADDGITQTGTVSRGVSGKLMDKEVAKPIVRLSPYRTFREVEQPEGEYLLRIRLDGDEQPRAALIEADGGMWKLRAMESIKAFITKECPGLTVL